MPPLTFRFSAAEWLAIQAHFDRAPPLTPLALIQAVFAEQGATLRLFVSTAPDSSPIHEATWPDGGVSAYSNALLHRAIVEHCAQPRPSPAQPAPAIIIWDQPSPFSNDPRRYEAHLRAGYDGHGPLLARFEYTRGDGREPRAREVLADVARRHGYQLVEPPTFHPLDLDQEATPQP